VRSRSSAVLLALAVAALAPSLGMAQYTPKWHVGDWWITKEWEFYSVSCKPYWHYTRYDVVRVEKVRNRDCYVLETRGSSRPNISKSGAAGHILYVRTEDWLIVRHVLTIGGYKPQPSIVRDCPRGLFGPVPEEPKLPRFPLRLGDPDTAFKNQKRDDGSAYLREISSVADPELVKRLLAEGDTLGSTAVRPSGAVYQVRNEMGGNLVPGPFPGEPGITQSLQFWCEGQPWRLYEELVQYEGKKRARYVIARSWLIASNRAEK